MDIEPPHSDITADADMRIDYGEGDDEMLVEPLHGGEGLSAHAGGEGDADMMADEGAVGEADAGVLEEAVMGELGHPWGPEEGAPHDEMGDDALASSLPASTAPLTLDLAAMLSSPTDSTSPVVPIIAHPGFSSPPLIQVSENGLQVSALGHSAADPTQPGTFSLRPSSPTLTSVPTTASGSAAASLPTRSTTETPITRSDLDSEAPAPAKSTGQGDVDAPPAQSQQRSDLQRPKTLAAQHQRSHDGTQEQEQTVENRGTHETRVTQSQEQDQPDGSPAVQENEVTITQETDSEGGEDHVRVETKQKNSGGATNGGTPIKQINHVKVIKKGDDCASCTCSGGTMERPPIRKSLLKIIEFGSDLGRAVETPDGDVDPDEEDAKLAAPTVLLEFNNTTYTLFRAAPADSEVDSQQPVLFSDAKQHGLYHQQIETLLEALHETLPGLDNKQEELVLSFDEIGIALAEDSVYTREVCLYDFDRIHVGCNLPGRLHIVLETQQRFSTGFNALAQHIANSYQVGDLSSSSHTVTEERYQEIIQESVNENVEEEPGVGGEGVNELDELAPGDDLEKFEDAGEGDVEAEGYEGGGEEEGRAEGGEGVEEEAYEDGEWVAEVVDGEEDGEYDEAKPEGEEEEAFDVEGALEDEDALAAVNEGAEADLAGHDPFGDGEEADEVVAEEGGEAEELYEGDEGESTYVDAEFVPEEGEEGEEVEPETSAPSITIESVAVEGSILSSRAPAPETEVLIDYEEAISSAPSPAPLSATVPDLDEASSPLSPKRSRSSLSEEPLAAEESSISDSKRQRIEEPEPPAPPTS